MVIGDVEDRILPPPIPEDKKEIIAAKMLRLYAFLIK